MKVKGNLPFEVGQLVETKSFEEGYRGAWFRCKIKDCNKKSRERTVALDYIDYQDYKNYWVSLYESPIENQSNPKKRHLMLRPNYPQIYHQSQRPDISEISETVGIVDGTWKVGDMVDWFNKDCYWSALITKILDDKNVEVELPEPPLGEGQTYKALCKDLRPSLDWTPKNGWTLPIFEVVKDLRHCVQLIKPKTPGQVRKHAVGSSETSSSVSSHTSGSSMNHELPMDSSRRENLKKVSVVKIENGITESPELSSTVDTSSIKNDSGGEFSWCGSVSSPNGDNSENIIAKTIAASREDRADSCGSSKKMRECETQLNSTSSDSIESSIMGLEELVNKVRLLKGALNYGIECDESFMNVFGDRSGLEECLESVSESNP